MNTTGSLSTYATLEPAAPAEATSCVLGAGGQAGPDVEELPDAGVAQEPDRAQEELAVGAGAVADLRHHRQRHFRGVPVG
jgi:hypothetical protein